MQSSELTADQQELLKHVPASDHIGNIKLRKLLGWDSDRYFKVRDELIARGLLAKGIGRGGVVFRIAGAAEDVPTRASVQVNPPTNAPAGVGDNGLTPDQQELVSHVPESAAIGNRRLKQLLKWDDDKYFKVRNELIDKGLLFRGRGLGGSVSKITARQSPEEQAEIVEEYQREADLYPKVKHTLETKWKDDQGLQDTVVEITAAQGARSTGGRWSRPDITSVSVQVYNLLPAKYLDVATFEVKPQDAWDISGVFEAAAHSRAATRSYLLIHTPKGAQPSDIDKERMMEECERFGVGLMTFENPEDFNTYDAVVEPERRIPDPYLLNKFLTSQLSPSTQGLIARWIK